MGSLVCVLYGHGYFLNTRDPFVYILGWWKSFFIIFDQNTLGKFFCLIIPNKFNKKVIIWVRIGCSIINKLKFVFVEGIYYRYLSPYPTASEKFYTLKYINLCSCVKTTLYFYAIVIILMNLWLNCIDAANSHSCLRVIGH